jgi:hypothetical protein
MPTGSISRRGPGWASTIELAKDPVTGKRRQPFRSGFPTKGAAAEAMRIAMTNSGTGSRMLFERFVFDEWLPVKATTVGAATISQYESHIGHWLIPRLGPIPLADLDRKTLQALEADLLTSGGHKGGDQFLSPRTVQIGALLHEHRQMPTRQRDGSHCLPPGLPDDIRLGSGSGIGCGLRILQPHVVVAERYEHVAPSRHAARRWPGHLPGGSWSGSPAARQEQGGVGIRQFIVPRVSGRSGCWLRSFLPGSWSVVG